MDVEFARAKLTLSLHVTGVRDDGYHLLDAEMVTLDLADTLLFAPGDEVEVIPLVETFRFTPTLVTDALAAVGRHAFVRLEKRIPVGAGLGGGSADAAAVLRWAGGPRTRPRRVNRRRRAVLLSRGPGAGGWHWRCTGAAAVRGAHIHPAHATDRGVDRRGLCRVGRPGWPDGR